LNTLSFGNTPTWLACVALILVCSGFLIIALIGLEFSKLTFTPIGTIGKKYKKVDDEQFSATEIIDDDLKNHIQVKTIE
jgi:hypothetical protein